MLGNGRLPPWSSEGDRRLVLRAVNGITDRSNHIFFFFRHPHRAHRASNAKTFHVDKTIVAPQ